MIEFLESHIIIFSIISFCIGIIGTILTIVFGLRTSKLDKEKIALEKERVTLKWQDLETAAKDLSIMIKNKFKPDLIFIPDTKDGTIVHMLKSHLSTELSVMPTLVGILMWKDEEGDAPDIPDYFKPFYFVCNTKKWRAFIPKEITVFKTRKVLVVDDMAITGLFGSELKKWFYANGFSENNVRFATIVSTSSANKDIHAPDFYWREINSFDFYFPWGKGR